jgi:hypothetical protein
MSDLDRCIRFADMFSEPVNVRFDCRGRYLVDVRYLYRKERKGSVVMESLCGCGETVQLACRDFLRQCVGYLVYDPPEIVGRRQEHVCIGIE